MDDKIVRNSKMMDGFKDLSQIRFQPQRPELVTIKNCQNYQWRKK